MKVIHIIIGLNVGGAELMLKRLVLSSQSTVEHVVISLTTIGEIGQELKLKGITVYTLELKGILNIAVVFVKLLSIIKRESPDIVQTWMYHADLIGGISAKLSGIDNIVWNVRSTYIDQNTSFLTKKIQKLCALLSHTIPKKIIFAAEKSKLVHRELGYNQEKLITISNGFEIDKIKSNSDDVQNLKFSLGLTNNEIVIGCIGRFNHAKGFDIFVKAAGELLSYNKNIRFLMIGRDMVNNPLLEQWINDTHSVNSFILLNERKDIPNCLALMDIFCLASRTEGFPNVLGEAMVMERLCVSTDVGDAALLLGDCGFIVEPERPDLLSEALLRALQLIPQQKEELGQKARRRVVEFYSMQACANKFMAVYQSIV